MKKKKSKFLTFGFSLLPGAGHMYMGFMKMGLSLMSAFFFIIFLSSWLDIGPLLYILPLLWFYAFFDCTNKSYSSDEEFLLFEDVYLFSLDKLVKIDKDIFKKQRLFSGVLLVIFGVYIIGNNIMNSLSQYIPYRIYEKIYRLTSSAPQIILSIIIIVIGVRLIVGKKKEGDING